MFRPSNQRTTHKKSGNRSCANVVVVFFLRDIYIKKKHVCFLESIALGCYLVTLCKCKHLFGIKNASLSSSSSSFFVCSEYKCRGFTSFFESRIQNFLTATAFCVYFLSTIATTAKCYLVPHKCCMRHQNARKLQEI